LAAAGKGVQDGTSPIVPRFGKTDKKSSKVWRKLHCGHLLLNGQEPPAQAFGEQAPDEQGSDECSWTLALKEESCFSSFLPPHFGHASGLSVLERTNCSNTVAHFSHLYS